MHGAARGDDGDDSRGAGRAASRDAGRTSPRSRSPAGDSDDGATPPHTGPMAAAAAAAPASDLHSHALALWRRHQALRRHTAALVATNRQLQAVLMAGGARPTPHAAVAATGTTRASPAPLAPLVAATAGAAEAAARGMGGGARSVGPGAMATPTSAAAAAAAGATSPAYALATTPAVLAPGHATQLFAGPFGLAPHAWHAAAAASAAMAASARARGMMDNSRGWALLPHHAATAGMVGGMPSHAAGPMLRHSGLAGTWSPLVAAQLLRALPPSASFGVRPPSASPVHAAFVAPGSLRRRHKEGKLEPWERERVATFVRLVKAGAVQVVRGTLASRMRAHVNPDRLQVFYEKLVSRRRLNAELAEFLLPRNSIDGPGPSARAHARPRPRRNSAARAAHSGASTQTQGGAASGTTKSTAAPPGVPHADCAGSVFAAALGVGAAGDSPVPGVDDGRKQQRPPKRRAASGGGGSGSGVGSDGMAVGSGGAASGGGGGDSDGTPSPETAVVVDIVGTGQPQAPPPGAARPLKRRRRVAQGSP